MPEEKVSQQECKCPPGAKYHVYGCALDGEPMPPAADAGPRQPQEAASMTIPSSNDDPAITQAVRKVVEDYGGTLQMLGNSGQPAPVPQKAAPHSKKCAEQLYSSMDAKCICGSDTVQATAPDEAMRVARQFCDEAFTEHNPTLVETWRNRLAALIREAGSERELRDGLRKANKLLQEIEPQMCELRITPKELTDVIAEASRLLGGE